MPGGYVFLECLLVLIISSLETEGLLLMWEMDLIMKEFTLLVLKM